LLGLVDNQLEDLSSFATKEELQNAVTALQPVDTVASGNLHSVTSNAVANNCEGKLVVQMQWASGTEGYWVQSSQFPQMWTSPYTITVPQGWRFVFAHVGIAWTSGNVYFNINFNNPLITDIQGEISLRSDYQNVNGIVVPQFKCVFEKIN
jgi:hypothetical protein